MGRTGGVAADQDRLLLHPLRELLAGETKDLDVVLGRVGAGASRSQDRGQRVPRRFQKARQGMKAEAVLVVAARLLLLRVRGDQRGVDIEHQKLGPARLSPDLIPHPSPRRTELVQVALGQPADDARGGGDGGDASEQIGLIVEDSEVAQAVAAVGDADREIGEHRPRMVGGAASPERIQTVAERGCVVEAISKLAQCGGARVIDDTLAVGGDRERGSTRAGTLHPKGASYAARTGLSNRILAVRIGTFRSPTLLPSSGHLKHLG